MPLSKLSAAASAITDIHQKCYKLSSAPCNKTFIRHRAKVDNNGLLSILRRTNQMIRPFPLAFPVFNRQGEKVSATAVTISSANQEHDHAR
jgi:hypothetical protein